MLISVGCDPEMRIQWKTIVEVIHNKLWHTHNSQYMVCKRVWRLLSSTCKWECIESTRINVVFGRRLLRRCVHCRRSVSGGSRWLVLVCLINCWSVGHFDGWVKLLPAGDAAVESSLITHRFAYSHSCCSSVGNWDLSFKKRQLVSLSGATPKKGKSMRPTWKRESVWGVLTADWRAQRTFAAKQW